MKEPAKEEKQAKQPSFLAFALFSGLLGVITYGMVYRLFKLEPSDFERIAGPLGLAFIGLLLFAALFKRSTAKFAGLALAAMIVGGVFALAQPYHPTTARVGESIRDKNFEFTVSSVECNKTDYGLLSPEPQGEYCLVRVSVKNVDSKAHSWSPRIDLYDAEQNKYSRKAIVDGSLSEIVNPNNSISATVVFDVATGTKLSSARIFEGPTKDGITIRIDQR